MVVDRGKKISPPKPQRHRWVRQWMFARGFALRELAAGVALEADNFEREQGTRKRERREADRLSHESLVQTIVANLAHAVLVPPQTGCLAVRAGNAWKGAGRYGNPAFGKGVRPTLAVLHELGILVFRLPVAMRGEVSSIAPTEAFAERVKKFGITLADIGIDEREEVLVLTRKAGTRAAQSIDRIDYGETAETGALRDEVRAINAFLGRADIDFLEDGRTPKIDVSDRLLKRRFVLLKGDDEAAPRFDRGGRLFGGFWMGLASSRRGNIRISGEPIADLDYSSMFARLAYAAIGQDAPDGDIYALPELEAYRSGIKLAFNIFLFDSKRLRSKWPKDEMGIGVGDDAAAKADPNSVAARFDGLLPAGWENPERLRKAILNKHPALKEAFGHRLGYSLMFTESCVLVRVLGELMMRRNIIALPLHDGLMVAQSQSHEAAEVMRKVAKEMTSAEIPMVEKAVGK